METQKCLYEILGVEATSSNEEIRSAYRKLALKWHPDKTQQTGASAEECQEATIHFQEIGRAYEVLADPSERSCVCGVWGHWKGVLCCLWRTF
ncbi:hypothetical protein GOP47_0011471 [Adiantum capillus-veneris]|uniref:J domain-containing protein n=1 Tax=Adiantum capillus-veneris TaxID=13818 RepID=A0A9D4UUA8_ADICA|nr:hypothetical protein GOP47_0011471 [Adiantum capillus-veneris]